MKPIQAWTSTRCAFVCEGINAVAADNPAMGQLIITHYQRMLNYIEPDYVHILFEGKIVKSGGKELALELEAQGYEMIEREFSQPRRSIRGGNHVKYK